MKSAIELPKKEDYFLTKIVHLTPPSGYQHEVMKESEAIKIRDGAVNLKQIIDYTACDMTVDVIDEAKMPEFEEKMKQLQSVRQGGQRLGGTMAVGEDFNGGVPIFDRPELPVRKARVLGTFVLYLNGVQRLICEDFNEFSQLYQNYLTKENLDIN